MVKTRVCETCGKEFRPSGAMGNAKGCSYECRMARSRRKYLDDLRKKNPYFQGGRLSEFVDNEERER